MLRFKIAKLESAVASLCGMLLLRSLDRWLRKSTLSLKTLKINYALHGFKMDSCNLPHVDAHTHTRERGADAFCGVRAASRPWHPPCAVLREACRHEQAKHRVHCVDTMCIRYECANRCGCVCVSALRICICTLYFLESPRSRKKRVLPLTLASIISHTYAYQQILTTYGTCKHSR